ncbi:MAG: biotin--[acetyl-CoA-carboxylase] ligase [Marmoricola sp.]
MPNQPSFRPPLDGDALAAVAGARWSVTLLPSAPSTNAVAADRARPGLVVVADHQTEGRGRLDRTWQTPPGGALTFSAVVDPGIPDSHWPLLPLAAGIAVAVGVRRHGLAASVKWPNDVLYGDRKLAGILLERCSGDARRPLAVVGIGVNVDQRADELPVGTATSLTLEGVEVSRTALLGDLLAALGDEIDGLAEPEEFLERYRNECVTLGRQVDVHLPHDEVVSGRASTVDGSGRLVLDTPQGRRAVGAGDVVHVRPVG